jgi:hypothetical protein
MASQDSVKSCIDKLFKWYLESCEDSKNLYFSTWKQTVLKLNNIVGEDVTLFNENTDDGFQYLNGMCFGTLCSACDLRVVEWLREVAKAWLAREENLPPFVNCKCRGDESPPSS